MTTGETPGVDVVLARARAGLRRLDPQQTRAAVADGALLVDTRTDRQRREQGELPGAIVIDRTVLEWRLDPSSPDRIPEAIGYDVLVIVVCRQGYSSSLAAASLRAVGLHRATDMIGGVQVGWPPGCRSTPGRPTSVGEQPESSGQRRAAARTSVSADGGDVRAGGQRGAP